jgi:hypothetical protein
MSRVPIQRALARMKRIHQGPDYLGEPKEFATDLLTDWFHYCRANGLDPEAIWHAAEIHFHEEHRKGNPSDVE